MEQEPEQLPDLHVSKMSQEDLDNLSYIFVSEENKYANFDSLWNAFIADRPTALHVVYFLKEIEELGYYVMQEIEHPYAKEYAGSHVGMTENGTPFHMTCSADFAESEEYRQLMEAINKAAKE